MRFQSGLTIKVLKVTYHCGLVQNFQQLLFVFLYVWMMKMNAVFFVLLTFSSMVINERWQRISLRIIVAIIGGFTVLLRACCSRKLETLFKEIGITSKFHVKSLIGLVKLAEISLLPLQGWGSM